MIHARILAGLQHELEARYEISSTIRHKGERGRSRETGVAGFLRDNLPEAYGVGTGEIFSFNGEGISPQCDVVVYDRMRTPVFGRRQPIQQIPIEGVYAVVEVRSVLDTGALRDAGEKFDAIRSIWASAKPKNAHRNWKDGGPTFFVFGFKLKTTQKSCLEFLKTNQEEDIGLFSLDSGCSVWIGPSDLSKPARPEWLETTVPSVGMYSTLAFFFFGVLQACQTRPQRLNIREIMLSC